MLLRGNRVASLGLLIASIFTSATYAQMPPPAPQGPMVVHQQSAMPQSEPEIEPSQLPALVRAAKDQFRPLTPEDLQAARIQLHPSIGQLNTQLATWGPEGLRWREYLRLADLEQQLAAPQPDLPTLDAVFQRFAAGHEGLQLLSFDRVRNDLRRYLTTARAIGQEKLREQYQMAVEQLAKSLDEYLKNPTADTRQSINDILTFLDQAQQAPQVAQAVRRQLSFPNLYVEVSKDVIEARIAGPVSDTSPVVDCILGTSIYGTAHSVGQTKVELVPSENCAMIDILFAGTAYSNTVGYNGPVTIFSQGTTGLAGRKRLVLDAETFCTQPAAASARTNTTICDIQAKLALIEKLAWRRAQQQKPQAEAIAAQHAEQKFSQRMNEQADPMLQEANANYQQKFRRLLEDRGLAPEIFRLSSTDQAVRLTVKEIADGLLAAPSAPPQVAGSAIALRVHETAINNLASAALGGMVLDEKRTEEIITNYFNLPQRIQTKGDEEEWSITFPERQPVAVQFVDNGFSITVSGRQYMSEGRDYPGMNITAVYQIQKTAEGLRAVRQGRLKILPPGFAPDAGQQLSARQQVLRNVLEPRFERIMPEVIAPEDIVMKREGQADVVLQLARWETVNGWLVMGWTIATPATPAGPQVQQTASIR